MALSDETIVSTSDENARRLAFGKALWDVYQTGILPDGHALEYHGMEGAANNRFNLADVDGDGQEELLIFWENVSIAGTVGYVFGYDRGEIYVALKIAPA